MTMGFSWESGHDPSSFAADLGTFRDNFFDSVEDDVEAAVDDAVDEAQSRARVDTGEMRSSIRGEVEKMASKVVAELIGGAEHTIYNEFGTIYMSAQPMIRPALRSIEKDLVERIARSWRSAARSL
ncbi:HK97-gp10 family putative phage morphogenesis protein [Halostagnicola sp. A-GB9-2]|uniref:HK97-gp10 family putative phage morphogenesis protein n=1 Tax=Halostagnicola sp. A-GB9-2 TaxID=3048066 RepID=UPI0024BF6E64|nr:HK97-gp10 family putative phage morphogenesis protein [Halostagnicola sp. A-GB9-2]MDJ1433592.1 HK97 gp10 family phage protein [Halostagnicola sp. A-GB9-2]